MGFWVIQEMKSIHLGGSAGHEEGCGSLSSDVKIEQKDLVHCVTGRMLHDSVSGLGKRVDQEGIQRRIE